MKHLNLMEHLFFNIVVRIPDLCTEENPILHDINSS